MRKILLSGVKALRVKIKEEIEDYEDKREKEKKESVEYSSLTKRIDYRYGLVDEIDHEIELLEKLIGKRTGGKEEIKS